MKQTIISIFLLASVSVFAQTETLTKQDLEKALQPLERKIKSLQNENTKLKAEIGNLNTHLSSATHSIDSLKNQTEINSKSIIETADKLGIEIKETNDISQNKISEISQSLSKSSLYGIIGVLLAILVSGIIYWLLGKRIANSKTDVETQIKNTKKSLEEESIKLDSKLVEVLESQLKLKQEEKVPIKETEAKDHSLVLKVADEVTRILMNLEVMDKEIRDYKHLKKYSESILDNLKAYGYEIPVLIGQPYSQGLNMIATLEFDENIEQGKQVIKRIIKPQVNYNHKMIQAAKVIVAFNE